MTDPRRPVCGIHRTAETDSNAVREELRGQVAALAVQGAEAILMREVDAKAHSEALEKLAAQL